MFFLISHIVDTIDVAHIKALWGPQSLKSTKGSESKTFENHCYNPMSTTKVEIKDGLFIPKETELSLFLFKILFIFRERG